MQLKDYQYNNPTFVLISLDWLHCADGERRHNASGFTTWSLCSSRVPPSRCAAGGAGSIRSRTAKRSLRQLSAMSMSASERGPTIDSKEACSVGESARFAGALSDARLASLAILRINWDTQQQSWIDNFVPFVTECLRIPLQGPWRSGTCNARLLTSSA
jgi:hypothetical protein